MIISEFLAYLDGLDVHLSVSGDRLSCDAPQGVLTPVLLAEISTRKPQIIEFIRQAQGSAAYPPVRSIPRSGPFPLSLGQERIWSLVTLTPDNPVYNMYLAFLIEGPLDKTALELSISEIVRRHEILHTCFHLRHGQPVQAVQPSPDEVFAFEKLPPSSDQRSLVNARISEEAGRPFRLDDSSLLRARLFQFSGQAADQEAGQARDQAHVLTLVMHHLVSDGWSWEIFLRELAACYAAYAGKLTPRLPELPIQYMDYAAWQHSWVESSAFAAQLDFWRQRLQGSRSLELPTCSAGSKTQSYQGTRRSLTLPVSLVQSVRSISRKEGTTLFVTLLAAFKALLYHHTGQEDILVLAPAACRPLVEFQNLIGYFNNLLAHRTRLTGQISFGELLARVNETSRTAFEHAEVPFHLVAELPDLARIPFTRAVFSLEDGSSRTLSLPNLSVTMLDVYNGIANFDLHFSVQHRENQLTCVVEYRTGQLQEEVAVGLLEDFQSLLQRAVADPALPIEQLLPEKARGSGITAPLPVDGAGMGPVRNVPPDSPVEAQLCRLWEEYLGVKPVGVTDNFFELGGHSLLALRLFNRIEREIGHNLPLAVLLEDPTVRHLARLIEGQAGSISWSCLVPIQPLGSKPPFFGVHGLEGNILFWRHLLPYLDVDQPFYGIQAQGIDGVSEPRDSIEEMARSYLEEIRKVQPAGPYYLGGYSLGGEVAFEMARQLVSSGEKVALLVLFDTYNPRRPVRSTWIPVPRATPTRRVQQNRFGVIRRKVQRHLTRLTQKNPLQQIDYLTFEASRRIKRLYVRTAARFYRAQKKRLPDSLLMDYLTLRHVQALDKYDPKVYPGRITLFRAKASLEKNPLDDPMGWGPLAADGVDYHLIESSHKLFKSQFVGEVASRLKECMEEAQMSEAESVSRT